MAIKKHVFISETGAALPRWVQAFPHSAVLTPQQSVSPVEADLIWLRLQSALPAAPQIQALPVSDAPLIILSDTPNDDEALAVFSLAARGYANSHAAAETLRQIARVVDQGGLWIGESLMQRMLTGVRNLPMAARAEPAEYHLTVREREVARAIAGGASNKEVARQLNITERTVKAHVSGLFVKMGVQDRLQLALKMRDWTGD